MIEMLIYYVIFGSLQVIILSEDFQRFFDRSTRLVERALCEMSDANLFVDYTGGYGDDDSEGLDGDKSGSHY